MSNPTKILVIDDDREMRDSLKHLLESANFEVQTLSRAEQVLSQLENSPYDVILSDVRMPGMTGVELLQSLKSAPGPFSLIPLVLMSAHGDIQMAVEAIQSGAYSFLEKPFDPRRLIRLLENAARMNQLTQNEARLKARLSDLSGLDRILIGQTVQISSLREDILDLADSDVNVMILGETGSGKELVARALHDLGSRASAPFVAINCAAIPLNQFEETLFGNANGSSGYLQQADGGTLFIDELGAIPPEVQAKLLRVIDKKEYAPVGSADIKQSDFRIISAGNEAFEAQIDDKEFREDLYFRLNSVVLKLPALRERRDDIPLLFSHFAAQFAQTYEIEAPVASPDDIAALLAHDWPGNVRELRSVAERRVLSARRGVGSVASALSRESGKEDIPDTLREAVAVFERQLIAKALATHQGRMDAVAESLGIGRRTLNEKIVKLGLNKDDVLNNLG
jgi:DNA-binding NtrC family response regulator